MALELRKVVKQARFLDPTADFAEAVHTSETRKDPLTGDECSVSPYRAITPPKPDLAAVIERSLRQPCPFCPELVEKVVPKFLKEIVPEGRVRCGECIVAPGNPPSPKYGAVARLSNKHFIGLGEFSEELLANAFLACQSYLRQVLSYDPNAKYQSFTWNYMPPAGASLVHAHFQLFADDSPMKHHGNLLTASKDYLARNSSNFWADLVAAEQAKGERYITTMGNVAWLTPFAPRACWDSVIAVFKGADSIANISEADFRNFAKGLRRVLGYLNDRNFYAFNLGLCSGLVGQDYFWTNARIDARALLPWSNDASEYSNMEKFQKVYRVFVPPERVCSELKKHFD